MFEPSCAMESFISAMESFITAMESFITAMESFITGMESFITGMESFITGMESFICAMESFISAMESFICAMERSKSGTENPDRAIKAPVCAGVGYVILGSDKLWAKRGWRLKGSVPSEAYRWLGTTLLAPNISGNRI